MSAIRLHGYEGKGWDAGDGLRGGSRRWIPAHAEPLRAPLCGGTA